MIHQVVFSIALVLTLAVFGFSVLRYARRFRITRKAFPVRNIGKRLLRTLKLAIGQTRILRRPVIGLLHALVFWGFCVILIGSIEMVVDGLTGSHRAFHGAGIVPD